MSSDFKRRLFDKLQKKTNVRLDAKEIESLANKVDRKSLANEQKLLGLIRQVAKLANVELNKEREEKILRYLKKNDVQNADMKTLLSLMNKNLEK